MTTEQQERSEREQGVRVLAPAPVPDPSPQKLRARRQHLLNEIDQQAAPRSAPRRELLRRRRMVLVLGSAAVAAVTVVAVSIGFGETMAPREVPPASAASVDLLERAALAAAAEPLPTARPDQYAYVKVVGHTTVLSEAEGGAMQRLREDAGMEQWTSVDGSRRTLQRKGGADQLLPEIPGKGSLNSPTYNFLAALPTDPDALLERIYEDAEADHGADSGSTTEPDQQAFVAIGDLLRSSTAPPAITASLYRAATRIPGVVAVPDAVDAAGRHGVAVARVHDGERTEWVFDKSTARLLGERTVLLEDNAWGKDGAVVASVAILDSGIVNKAGRTP
ncbi:CU044_5270 family protein [Streptomyces griseus]|uniref:CU044_5270 family protein n=1 Tax=Streptomyces stephensoniae TaxID=3375367 RepID=A0ABU2W4N6_9ACTN|nr:CU044_5270 family protein [Streptomyces griseus]MDT0492264.1 CU044_5270 family protein [Streptomyces griseus]